MLITDFVAAQPAPLTLGQAVQQSVEKYPAVRGSLEQVSAAAAGINLAELPTPMLRQAADVHDLTLRHNALHAARWRNVQVPLEKDQTPHLLKALDALDDLEADILREQRAAAQPRPRHFEVVAE